MFSVLVFYLPLPVVGRGFFLVRLSEHVIEQLLSEPKQFRFKRFTICTIYSIREYIVNASVLNTCITLYERAATAQRLFGGKYNWDMMASAIESLREQFGHTLPASTLRFRRKVAEYKKDGYRCLVSGKFGNQSARKVDFATERLILGLASMPNKPFKF